MLSTQPASAGRDQRELPLQLGLGGSLTGVRGYSHTETGTAYERARALCEAVNDPEHLGLALTGLAIFFSTRGEVQHGRELAARVLAVADEKGDSELAVWGHLYVAVAEHNQGKLASSVAHCQLARASYDADRHPTGWFVVLGDPGIGARCYEAWNLWLLGYPDRALIGAREAVLCARQLDHPFTLAFALFFQAATHWYRRETLQQQELAQQVMALGEAQGFPLWFGVGRAFWAAGQVAAGHAEAISEIGEGLRVAGETGSQSGAPALMLLLAEAQQATRHVADAQTTVAVARALAQQTGQPFVDAEVHRLDGDLLLATGGGAAAARYHRALAIAREQGTCSFELRAATSLARLLREQGRPAEARELLAPIYGWFTEGFDTGDLVEAKALLEQLT